MSSNCINCRFDNICSECQKEILEIGRFCPDTGKTICIECFKIIVVKEKEARLLEEKKNDKMIIGACINRDYTEKLYRNNFRLQPKKLESLIRNHRRNVYKNTRNVVPMTKQQQDYVTKTTEHL